MRLIGPTQITPENVDTGDLVYLTEQGVKYLSTLYHKADPDYQLPGGFYKVIAARARTPDPATVARARIAKDIWIFHEDWPRENKKGQPIAPIKVRLTIYSKILWMNTILISDGLMPVVESLDTLIEKNKTRWTCYLCNKPLNVVFMNMRVCKDCENPPIDEEDRETGNASSV